MSSFDLLTPWITFAAILIPLLYLERWIHQHLYGVGWLLFSKDRERATLLYYLILLPGVFLHEFSQWLMAGALGVRISKVKVWPKPQRNGTLRLDFVQIKKTDRFRAAILGLVPLLSGIGVVWYISQNIFNIEGLSAAFQAGELPIILAELQRLFTTPDFWLWLYLLFAIGNAMMPTPSDRKEWPLLLGIFGVISIFLITIGLGEEMLIPTLQGPVNRILNTLVTAFSTVLVLDIFAVLALGLLEKALEKATGEHMKYGVRKKSAPRPEPGGDIPLPPDQAPARITERKLPIPPAPEEPTKPRIPEPQLTPAAAPEPGNAEPAKQRPTPRYAAQKPEPPNIMEPQQEEARPRVGTRQDMLSYRRTEQITPEDISAESGEAEDKDDSDELHYVPLDDVP